MSHIFKMYFYMNTNISIVIGKKTEKISTRIKGVLVDLGDRGLGAFFGVTTIVYICSNEMNGYHMLIIGLFLSTWRGTSGR